MAKPTHKRTPGALRSTLHVLRNLLLGAAVAIGFTATLMGSSDAVVSSPRPSVDPHVTAMMAKYNCSSQGFGGSVYPQSALLRTSGGRVALVSFERGWAAFKGDRPGTLMAVCLGKKADDKGSRLPAESLAVVAVLALTRWRRRLVVDGDDQDLETTATR